MAAAHRRFGTTGFLPTLISGDLDVIAQAIAAVDDAIAPGVPALLGIHIEGPFLSPARKGIHDASKFRELDAGALALISSLKHGKTLVTLAPEETTPEMIAALVKAGVIVSAGHTNATYDEMRAALDARLSRLHAPVQRHVAAHQPRAGRGRRGARRPATAGAASSSTAAMSTRWSLRIALHCKSADKLMLVTDAMPSVGAAEKTFRLQGRPIIVPKTASAWRKTARWRAPISTWRAPCATRCSCSVSIFTAPRAWPAAIRRRSWASPAKWVGLRPATRANLVLDDG